MAIQEKLLKFKYHLIVGTIVSVLLLSLVLLAPRFVYVLAYFWPLFLSTAMFLVAAVLFGLLSPTEAEAEAEAEDSGEKPGAGILDYVAGQPVQVEMEEKEEEEEEPSKSDEGKQMGQVQAEAEEEEEPSKASEEGKQMGSESRLSDE